MKRRAGRSVFVVRFWPTFLTLLMLPVLLGLGTWQVHRLHWKQGLLAEIADRANQPPVMLPLPANMDADFRPATASGVFHHEGEFFVFSTAVGSGQGGYHVVTPLQLADGHYLLIDRGWIPYAKKKERFSQPTGQVYITGILRRPEKPGWIQSRNDPTQSHWYSIDLVAMAHADKLGSMLPYVLEADASPNEGGYPVGGQTRLTLPNNHFSYALTWYSLAAVLVIIFGLSSYRKDAED